MKLKFPTHRRRAIERHEPLDSESEADALSYEIFADVRRKNEQRRDETRRLVVAT